MIIVDKMGEPFNRSIVTEGWDSEEGMRDSLDLA
jgi:hypothetical protein